MLADGMPRRIGWMLFALALPVLAQDPAKGRESPNLVAVEVAKDMPLTEFLDSVAKATGKSLLYDPNNARVRAQKTGAAIRREVPKDRLFDAYRGILAYYELRLVPIGPKGYEVYLVLDSRSTNNLIKNRAVVVDYRNLSKVADQDGVYISCAIPIKHIENLTHLRTALSTMVSPAGIGRVHEVPGSKSIIVMDYAPTVAGIAKLIEQMDVEEQDNRHVMETIELKYARAEELAVTLTKLMESVPTTPPAPVRGRLTAARKQKPRIVPYGPRNAILVSAVASDFEKIKNLVGTLDLPAKQWTAVESPLRRGLR